MRTAREWMSTPTVSVSVTATVADALALLRTLDVRHLPVVNERDELVGILSDRDLERASSAQDVDAAPDPTAIGQVPVSTVMRRDPPSVGPGADARDIFGLMVAHRVGAVPVVDADGTVVGVVSYVDLLGLDEADSGVGSPLLRFSPGATRTRQRS